MAMIKGIKVRLKTKDKAGVDPFGAPIFNEKWVDVDNVLVGQPSTEEVVDTLNLHGKKIVYMLAIPKEDNNIWTDTEVHLPSPFEGVYRTVGKPMAGVPENMPLKWNKKVRLEQYE